MSFMKLPLTLSFRVMIALFTRSLPVRISKSRMVLIFGMWLSLCREDLDNLSILNSVAESQVLGDTLSGLGLKDERVDLVLTLRQLQILLIGIRSLQHFFHEFCAAQFQEKRLLDPQLILAMILTASVRGLASASKPFSTS